MYVSTYVCMYICLYYTHIHTQTYTYIRLLKLRIGYYGQVFEPNGIITCSFPSNIEEKNEIT